MNNKIIYLFLILGMALYMGASANAVEGPTAQLKPTLKALTDILSDESLKGDGRRTERRAKVMTAIKIGFDFQEMSKRILGRTWNEIGADEQKRFTELMTKLLENVYIGKLESYSGQQIEYLEERIKGDRAQVTTSVDNKGVKIPMHYILNLSGSKWMVYDINIEGVSLVKNYMEQFKTILRKEKFTGLIKVLEEKNRSFETVKKEGK